MTELVIRNYWWPGVMKDVRKYMDEYDICQRMKNRTKAPAGKLMANEVPEKVWTHLIVDFIMKLLLVAGKDAILVVCNRLSKMAHFVATIEETTVEGLTRLFKDNVWKLYGLPESIISDRGPQFAAELTKELNKILEIETRLSTAFYLLLIDIINTFDLSFLYSTDFVSTRYLDNNNYSNSVIDLMFLRPNSLEFDSHIYQKL